jgi:hypothetical protein
VRLQWRSDIPGYPTLGSITRKQQKTFLISLYERAGICDFICAKMCKIIFQQ